MWLGALGRLPPPLAPPLAAKAAGLLPVACRLLLEPFGDLPRPGCFHLVAVLVVPVQFLCQRLCLLAVDLVQLDLLAGVQLEALALDALRRQGGGLAVALWLLDGLLADLLRGPLRWLAKPFRALASALGVLIVLPFIPGIFLGSFLLELFRRRQRQAEPGRPAPSTPMQTATRCTADVIDLAAFRRRNNIK